MKWEHTYPSLKWDPIEENGRLVISTWPLSLTALVKQWSSISARTDVRLVCCNGEWQVEISRREKENGVVRVGKWGLRENQDGLSRFVIFNHANYYRLLPDGSKVCCDEPSNAVFWWVLLVDLVFLLQFLLIVPVAYFGSLFHWEVNRLEIHSFQ